ncbi:MAG TPA: pilus assembly protein TadG-related protein [Candidatus Dormibacteraeota bacterium]
MVLHEIRGRKGQAIVIMALAMVAICGMLALAIDAGRLYFQRRLMQDAVDAGALAGAQDLVGTVANPNGVPSNALFHALQDTFSVFGQTPANAQGSSFYNSPPSNTVTDTEGGYTVTAVAPTGYDNKQIQVTVSYNAVATFVQVLGFNRIGIVASATAEAGTNPKTYALFAYTSGGSGNTIFNDQGGYAQVDDGQDGADVCNTSVMGQTVSNAKFHVPNPTQANLNVNGDLTVNSASDNHGLFSFWQTPVSFGAGADPEPDYHMPDVSSINFVKNPTKKAVPPGGSAVWNGATITNTSSSKWVYVYLPGEYTTTQTIPASGDNGNNSEYIFLNGIYYFTSGANLTITGGYISNTSTGLPHYANNVGATDLPAASDGTNGVELIFDGGSAFSANNSSLPNDGSVFFVAPHFTPTGSTNIAFFIAPSNGNTGQVWSETFNASSSNVPRFQVWGTVFDADPSGQMTVTGVEVGPHNQTPTDGNSNNQYAINGEFIGAYLNVDGGNVLGNTAGAPGCPGFTAGTPALLVQYNTYFAPAPGVNSYLIK